VLTLGELATFGGTDINKEEQEEQGGVADILDPAQNSLPSAPPEVTVCAHVTVT